MTGAHRPMPRAPTFERVSRAIVHVRARKPRAEGQSSERPSLGTRSESTNNALSLAKGSHVESIQGAGNLGAEKAGLVAIGDQVLPETRSSQSPQHVGLLDNGHGSVQGRTVEAGLALVGSNIAVVHDAHDAKEEKELGSHLGPICCCCFKQGHNGNSCRDQNLHQVPDYDDASSDSESSYLIGRDITFAAKDARQNSERASEGRSVSTMEDSNTTEGMESISTAPPVEQPDDGAMGTPSSAIVQETSGQCTGNFQIEDSPEEKSVSAIDGHFDEQGGNNDGLQVCQVNPDGCFEDRQEGAITLTTQISENWSERAPADHEDFSKVKNDSEESFTSMRSAPIYHEEACVQGVSVDQESASYEDIEQTMRTITEVETLLAALDRESDQVSVDTSLLDVDNGMLSKIREFIDSLASRKALPLEPNCPESSRSKLPAPRATEQLSALTFPLTNDEVVVRQQAMKTACILEMMNHAVTNEVSNKPDVTVVEATDGGSCQVNSAAGVDHDSYLVIKRLDATEEATILLFEAVPVEVSDHSMHQQPPSDCDGVHKDLTFRKGREEELIKCENTDATVVTETSLATDKTCESRLNDIAASALLDSADPDKLHWFNLVGSCVDRLSYTTGINFANPDDTSIQYSLPGSAFPEYEFYVRRAGEKRLQPIQGDEVLSAAEEYIRLLGSFEAHREKQRDEDLSDDQTRVTIPRDALAEVRELIESIQGRKSASNA